MRSLAGPAEGVHVCVCVHTGAVSSIFLHIAEEFKKVHKLLLTICFFFFFFILRLFPAGPALTPWQLSTSEGCSSGSSGHSFHMRLHETGRREQEARACSSSGDFLKFCMA